MASPHLDDPDPTHRKAATFGLPEGGPAVRTALLLVVAGASNTGTLAHRGPPGAERRRPRRVLLLTFTRRAAEEMARYYGATHLVIRVPF